MRGAIKQSIRNHVASLVFGLSPVLKKAADAVTELSIGYPESPLNGGGQHLHRGPLAGERAPIREKELPVGAGATPRFALFAQSSGETVKQLLARYANLLEPDLREPLHAGGLWLVRPDGYVALATKQGRWDEVTKYQHRARRELTTIRISLPHS